MTVISTPEHRTMLAVGIVALEFSAAVSTFVSSTLLPTVARDLHARNHLGLLLAGSTIGVVRRVAGGRSARASGGGGRYSRRCPSSSSDGCSSAGPLTRTATRVFAHSGELC
jgi:hypothetical protein